MYSTHLHSNLRRSEDMVGGLFTSHTPVGLGAQTQVVRPASQLLHWRRHAFLHRRDSIPFGYTIRRGAAELCGSPALSSGRILLFSIMAMLIISSINSLRWSHHHHHHYSHHHHLCVCMHTCVCIHICMPRCICGGPRTTS